MMLKYDYAPIALFAYRRVRHLELTLDALSKCPEFPKSQLFVFSDAAKSDLEKEDVQNVRAMLWTRQLPNMTIVEAPQHRGLAASVSAGVTDLCERFGRAIVLEDDLLVSPATLQWFNAALDKYQDHSDVWQISAQQFSVPEFLKRREGMFLHLTTSWGWATWKRAWRLYDPLAEGWERLLTAADMRHAFDLDGAYPFSQMLIDQMAGRVDSWAIRWRWSLFRAGAISLYPPRSLTRNIGFDATATHTRFRLIKRLVARSRNVVVKPNSEPCPDFPPHVEAYLEDDRAVSRAVRDSQKFWRRLRLAMGWTE